MKLFNARSVAFNRLVGTIPDSIGSLENLKMLDIGVNRFVGQLPPSLVNLRKLELLLISNIPTASGPVVGPEQVKTCDAYSSGYCIGASAPLVCRSNQQNSGVSKCT